MQPEKPKNKRRWSIRVLESLIVIAAIALTVNLFLPDDAFKSIIYNEATVVYSEPVVNIVNEANVDANNLYFRARKAQEVGDYEEALTLVNLAIDLDDTPPTDYLWLQAWLLGEVDEHEAGIEAYLALFDIVPGQHYANIYAGLCFNYGSLADFDKATEYCGLAGQTSSLSQFSSDSMCYIHGFTGQYETAVEECNDWIAHSGHAYAYNNRSRAYLMLGEYEQTIRDATEAIARHTDRPEMPYTNRGLAQLALGQYQAGYADLMVAYGADSNYPDIYLGFALYHDRMGNRDDAHANYCRYLDMAWVTPRASVLQRIDTLGGCE